MEEDVSAEQAQMKSNPRIAFSDKVESLRNAIDLLYIPKNLSGRNRFREKWPEIAHYLFGDELIRYDNEGTTNREHRAELESHADIKRAELKKILDEFEDLSVKDAFLDLDYVGATLDKMGPMFASYLYAENVIARVRPSMMQQKPAEEKPAQDQKLSTEEKQILSNAPTSLALENVSPIITSAPKTTLPPPGRLQSAFNVLARHAA